MTAMWVWVIAALAGGILLGGAIVYAFSNRRSDLKSTEELQQEMDRYRQEVTDHYVKTAALVNDLTRSYKAVYDHLETGAYRLVGEDVLRSHLSDVQSETIQIEYLGTRALTPGDDGNGQRTAAARRPTEAPATRPAVSEQEIGPPEAPGNVSGVRRDGSGGLKEDHKDRPDEAMRRPDEI